MLADPRAPQGAASGDSEHAQPDEGISPRASGPGDKGSGSQPLLLHRQLVKLSAKLHVTNCGTRRGVVRLWPPLLSTLQHGFKAWQSGLLGDSFRAGLARGSLGKVWAKRERSPSMPPASTPLWAFLHREKHTSLPEQQSMVTESCSQVQA